MKHMGMVVVVVVVIVGLGVAGCRSDGDAPSARAALSADVAADATMALPPSAVAEIEALLADKAARTPAQRKISSQLLYARSGRFARLPQFTSSMRTDAAGRVLVDVQGDSRLGLIPHIEALGGTVLASSARHRSVRAWVDLARLEELASRPNVQFVRPALEATTMIAGAPGGGAKFSLRSRAERIAAVQRAIDEYSRIPRSSGPVANAGSVDSQGDTAHGAVRARKFFNTDGTGVTICTLSDSDDFKEQSISTGDLPADTITVPGQSGRPGSGEGTAMMEIIHDLAPGAKLVFATAFNSPQSFADNIRLLRSAYHCDVIVDDVIYFFESPYQDDIIAQAVDDVTADGALYFSSAGNQGHFDDGTSGTWEGDFKPAGTLATLPSGYTIHDFGSGAISDRVEAFGGPLFLHWSDRGTLDDPASSNDYDLFLLTPDLRQVVAASTDVQNGTGLPFEFLGFGIPPNYRVVIARKPGAQTRALHLQHFGGELALSTPGATYGHCAAADAFAVGAVDAAEAGGGEFFPGPTTPIELFSADGYRRVFYDRDGRRITPDVTFGGGGGELRLKPELVAADGVSTSFPSFTGLNPFYGTSAAAPHAAAIAGLIKSAVHDVSAAEVRQAMTLGALDIEADGFDRDSGAGIASAMNSLREAGARPAVFLDLGAVTVSPQGADVLLPGGSAQLVVELVNDGGAQASNVNATLLSGSPYVTVTRGSAAYPNIPPGGAATNPAPFAISVSPAAPCGAQLGLTLVVTFSGHGTSPSVFGLSVRTGRASSVATTFSYGGPVVPIPDADAAGVNVSLPVSLGQPLAKLRLRIDGNVCTTDEGATTVGVDHTWVGDLVFRLTSPTGTTVPLIERVGASGNNFCQTVLDDAATTSIQSVTAEQAPFTGTFAPANPQAAFAGDGVDGMWTLNVSDLAFADIGNVRAFSLDLFGYSCDPAP